MEVANAMREQVVAASDIARSVEQIAQMTEDSNATMQSNVENATQLQGMAQ